MSNTSPGNRSSQWSNQAQLEQQQQGPTEQRRVRHLSSIEIRNLTLNPHLSSLLNPQHLTSNHSASNSSSSHHNQASASTSTPSSSPATATSTTEADSARQSHGQSHARVHHFASDDSELYIRPRRRRATSNASLLSLKSVSASSNASSNVASGSDIAPASRTMRRSSSGGPAPGVTRILGSVAPDLGIPEVDSPPQLSDTEASQPPSWTTSPLPSASASNPSTSTSPSTLAAATMSRNRSTSRSSLASAGSGSTIRASVPPRVAEEDPSSHPSPPPLAFASHQKPNTKPSSSGRGGYTSEAQLTKDKERRADTLRRRLLDTLVTISLVPTSWKEDGLDGGNAGSSHAGSSGRHRGGSGSSMVGPSKGSLVRSDSIGGRGRNRTLSSASTSTIASSSPLAYSSTNLHPSISKEPSPPPFFVSQPQLRTTHPRFEIDSDSFLIEDPENWIGMGEDRILVKVWTRGMEVVKDAKGKGKERQNEEKLGDWSLLVEWDVDLDGLVNLGRDPLAFPNLPPNSLIFCLHNEYYTAPLPSRFSRGEDSDLSEEDDGNLSDPGTVALTARRRRREREEEEIRRRRKIVVEKSKRETRMVYPASVDSILALLQVQQEANEARSDIKTRRKQLDEVLEQPDGFFTQKREASELQDRIQGHDAQQAQVAAELEEMRERLKARREALDARRARLKAVKVLEEQSRAQLDENGASMFEDEAVCRKIQSQCQSRRTQLITLLSHIFPIEPAPVEDSASSLLFTILDLALPNSSYPPGTSDDVLSSALGYAAQLVSLLASYLGVPLHYPINCLGSRSVVMDLISVMRGPRAFPLYGKGVDKYRFDYAVFLLNKNIEQLMYSQGLTVIDLRNTLPNLKALILSLSYDPSHSEFSASSLVSPFQLPNPPDPPLAGLTGDILEDNFTTPLALHIINGDETPSTSSDDEGDGTSDSDEYDDDGQILPRSPSTIKALSVRSSSPVPTLRDSKVNGNGSVPSLSVGGANGNGTGVPSVGLPVEKGRRRTVEEGAQNGKEPLLESVSANLVSSGEVG
ncbi:hypothetical protein T439DRAFT_377803 [Meredithblackwellia eburnea MCA 4105]